MKIHVLGSGGWMPGNNRETSCLLIEYKGKLLMIDAGTGVANLSGYGDVLDRYNEIHILLSHYHLDHIIGLTYISKFFGSKKICIYGPQYGVFSNVKKELSKLFIPSFHSRSLKDLGESVLFFEYTAIPFMIDDILVETRELNHSSITYAFFIDKIFAYISDTLFLKKIIEETANFKWVFHECWGIEKTNAAHSYLQELKEKLYCTCKYYLIHLNPDIPYCEYKEAIKGFDNVYVGQDFDMVLINNILGLME